MRMSALIIFALLLAGCRGSQAGASLRPALPKPRVSLTSAQATTLAIELANDKADDLFHHRPFEDGRPAQFVTGKWVWTDGRGVAMADYQVSVTLAADGTTNSVDVQLLDDMLRPTFPPSSPRGIRNIP